MSIDTKSIANVTVWGLLGLGVGATLGGAAWDKVGKGAAVGAAIGVAIGALTTYGQGAKVAGFPQVGAGRRDLSPERRIADLEEILARPMPNDLDEEGMVYWLRGQARTRSQLAQFRHEQGMSPDINFTDGGSTYPARENISGLAIDEAFADVGRRLHGSFRATGYKVPPRGFAGWRRPMTHAPRLRRRRSPYGT